MVDTKKVAVFLYGSFMSPLVLSDSGLTREIGSMEVAMLDGFDIAFSPNATIVPSTESAVYTHQTGSKSTKQHLSWRRRKTGKKCLRRATLLPYTRIGLQKRTTWPASSKPRYRMASLHGISNGCAKQDCLRAGPECSRRGLPMPYLS
jgi:hypothetical protein